MRAAWFAVPPVAVTCALVAFIVAELLGAHPLTLGPPQNASEAVAMRDYAAVLRFGARPGALARVEMIRRNVMNDHRMFTTPAEAAVMEHDRDALDLLAAHGGWSDSDRAHLACLARDLQDGALAALFDPSGSMACASDDGLARVLRRP
ncbi:MAG TPA: hypothetical protein VG818_04875 [Gemmatimonadaceae bacterium]|nr:hypothetical protein [Gemmatimonadaceae bacterium]